MDEHDEHDELDDLGLGAVLRGHGEELTGTLDTEGALRSVRERARARRRWRAAGGALGTAAAAATVVVVASVSIGDRGTVRTPAASVDRSASSVAPTMAPTPTSPPSSVALAPPGTTAADGSPASVPVPLSPTESIPASPITTAPAARDEVASRPTSTFTSAGGSVVVRLAGGTASLVGDPSPTAGWSFRIDDDGPTRVRVRFERDGRRSEIRVDVRGDELVPEIIEQ